MRSSSISVRDLADPVERGLLLRPAAGEPGVALLRVGELALDRLAHVLRLLAHRGELDLELPHGAVGLVELDRRAVDLHLQAGRGLVDEVDRLVGQLPVGDVAVGEHGRGDERSVADPDAVVRLVLLLQAAQDRDRVDDRRLADEDRLEAALERGVLLDVLAVLVERRRADGAQLAARQHRLQQLGRVDGALGRAGADDRVQLVDEEDDLALGVLDLGEDGLQPLLELAAVLRPGEERADVERPDALALQALGHVAGDDPLREPLGDRGLADAGLADQHRVVLRAAREHLDHAPDLLVAADHRVELPLLRRLGQVAAELRERLVGALGILARDALPAADLLDLREQLRRAGRRRARAAGARSRRTRPRASSPRRTPCRGRARTRRPPAAAATRPGSPASRRAPPRSRRAARRRRGRAAAGSSWSSRASSRCSG